MLFFYNTIEESSGRLRFAKPVPLTAHKSNRSKTVLTLCTFINFKRGEIRTSFNDDSHNCYLHFHTIMWAIHVINLYNDGNSSRQTIFLVLLKNILQLLILKCLYFIEITYRIILIHYSNIIYGVYKVKYYFMDFTN